MWATRRLRIHQPASMRSIMVCRPIACFLLFSVFASISCVSQVVGANLNGTDPEIVLGQPVVLTLALTATQATVVDLGANRVGNLRFSIAGPGGVRSATRLPIPEFSLFDPVKLEPDRIYVQRINLAAVLVPIHPGSYSIGVEIVDPAKGATILRVERPVEIKILARDSERLRSVCERLSDTIVHANSAVERMEATSELSSIQDPVCVASMRALLERPFGGETEVLRALGRIETAESVEAIRVSLSSADRDAARVARSALVGIESRTRDPLVREQAREALQAGISER